MRVHIRVECPIEITKETEELYTTLKSTLKRAEKIANDGRVKLKTRLDAFRLVGYIASILASILKDYRLDEIQRELLELEERHGDVLRTIGELRTVAFEAGKDGEYCEKLLVPFKKSPEKRWKSNGSGEC